MNKLLDWKRAYVQLAFLITVILFNMCLNIPEIVINAFKDASVAISELPVEWQLAIGSGRWILAIAIFVTAYLFIRMSNKKEVLKQNILNVIVWHSYLGYWVCRYILGYQKVSLTRVPIPVQFELVWKGLFKEYEYMDGVTEKKDADNVSVETLQAEPYTSTVNLILADTYPWLNSKAKTARKYSTIFYRSENEFDLKGFNKAGRNSIETALNKEVLIVSLGAKLKIEKCKLVRDWFVANEFADFGSAVTNYFMSRRLPKGFVEDEKIRKKVVDYLSSFDESIKGFRIEEVPKDDESKEPTYRINTIHKKVDSDDTAEIPLGMESAGTLKMFALYSELQEVISKGSVLFIDELNARLHPLLVRNFILIFLNPETNVNHAQLIFTTHDTWQLSNQLLRRDEIWFTEKDKQGVSTLYSLADFIDEDGTRIRKDESYEKNYLLGKYGAIPTLKTIDLIRED